MARGALISLLTLSPGVRRNGSEALYEPPADRPVSDADKQLDKELLPLLAEQGADVSTLIDAAEKDRTLPTSQVLPWVSGLAHYRLIERAPQDRELWQLTDAGRERLSEITHGR